MRVQAAGFWSGKTRASLYAVLVLVFTLLLAIQVPPLQYPDEGAHLVRADQISHLGFVAHRLSAQEAGGEIDQGLGEAIARFYPLVLMPDAHATRSMMQPIAWGSRVGLSFPNTAIYPPFFYLPASLGILVGKFLGLDVLQTTVLMRVATALVSVAVASAAIFLAGSAGVWLSAILLLPASAMLMSAISQDGPMLASAALAAALMIRLLDARQVGWRFELGSLTILLALLAMSRPPYVAFAILPLIVRTPPVGARRMASLACLALPAGWWAICAVHVMVNTDPTRSAHPMLQIRWLVTHLAMIPSLLVSTFRTNFARDYAGYFISPLALPANYYTLAWCVLAIAAVTSFTTFRPNKPTLMILASVLAASAGVFLIQYLTWTPVGFPLVNGVLGRYFLPPSVIMGACFAHGQHREWSGRRWMEVCVWAFPIISIVVVMDRVVTRFYF